MKLSPPIDKQEIFPSHPYSVPFKSLSLTGHEKEQGQRKEEICTTKDLSESFKEFKSVRLTSPEDRRLPRSFNDRGSHRAASCNQFSSETIVEQKDPVKKICQFL